MGCPCMSRWMSNSIWFWDKDAPPSQHGPSSLGPQVKADLINQGLEWNYWSVPELSPTQLGRFIPSGWRRSPGTRRVKLIKHLSFYYPPPKHIHNHPRFIFLKLRDFIDGFEGIVPSLLDACWAEVIEPPTLRSNHENGEWWAWRGRLTLSNSGDNWHIKQSVCVSLYLLSFASQMLILVSIWKNLPQKKIFLRWNGGKSTQKIKLRFT